jgi:catechol 2,3-dioxygenase-like lactoylglutathione lyase family enzyme
MTSTQTADTSTATPNTQVDMKLEVVLVPVSDVDRAKTFYVGLGWRLDADFPVSADFRVVQLTPPGSAASIIFGAGLTSAVPGSVEGLQLTVADIDAARAELLRRGVDVSEVFHDASGGFHHAGTQARVAGPQPEHRSYGSFASFADPDGNGWLVQEVTVRAPGRTAMPVPYDSADDLARRLRRAAIAHGEHEARTGQADPEWPSWYAEFMVAERTGQVLPS